MFKELLSLPGYYNTRDIFVYPYILTDTDFKVEFDIFERSSFAEISCIIDIYKIRNLNVSSNLAIYFYNLFKNASYNQLFTIVKYYYISLTKPYFPCLEYQFKMLFWKNNRSL